MARNQEDVEELICPPPSDPLRPEDPLEETGPEVDLGLVDLDITVPVVPRAHLAGRYRTVVDTANYRSLPDGYFDGTLQEATPALQRREDSPFFGSTWEDYSTRPIGMDRFRFVMNSFWTRTGEENFVYAGEVDDRRPFIVNSVTPDPLGIFREDIEENFNSYHAIDEVLGKKLTLRIAPRRRYFNDPPQAEFGPSARDFAGISENSSYEPLFNTSKGSPNSPGFLDHSFKISAPFSEREIKSLGTISRPNIEKRTVQYNFYDQDYERSIVGQSDLIQLYPNLYVSLAEKNSTNRSGFYGDNGGWTPGNSSIYDRFLTLAGRIQQVYMDVLNERGEKIGEKDKGEYFTKWAKQFSELKSEIAAGFPAGPDVNFDQIRSKYKNIIFSPYEMDLLNSYGEKKALFPMYVDLQFTTDIETDVAQAMKEAELNTSLVRAWLQYNPQEGGPDSIPSWMNTGTSFTISTESLFQVESDRQDTIIELQTSIQNRTTPLLDLLGWWELYSQPGPQGGNNIYTREDYVTIATSRTELFQNPSEDNEFIRIVNGILFDGRLNDICLNKFRTYQQILEGELARSETVFYRISKHKVRPNGSAVEEPLQQIFIPNSNELDVVQYVDTQAAYEENLRYRVTAYELIYGTEYVYRNPRQEGAFMDVDVYMKPSLKLAQIPYYEFDARVTDKPPLVPDIDIIPFKGIDNRLLMNFAANTGVLVEQPIALDTEEEAEFAAIRQNQGVSEKEPITFRGDDEIDYYEVFRLTEHPASYRDFADNLHAIADSENYGARALRASATSLIDRVAPNVKYYYMFRAVDIHGNTSNPSPVYETQIVSVDGSVYHLISVVDFKKPEPLPANKTFSRFLNISPTLEQEEIIITNEVLPDTATAADVRLGATDDNVFVPKLSKNRKYKFRITSKQSGKKIDLNVTFKHQHISDTDA